MRTVYLATSAFGAAVLERLAASDHRPKLVVTRPDRPRGRGRRVASPPAAEAARALGIEVAQPESVNSEESRARITAAAPEVVAICAFGGLIMEPLLSEHPMLNVHPSLLPRWRGAAPIERAIEAGDAETGISIMRPVAELDAGPVCLIRAERIHPEDDFGTLSRRLEQIAGGLLVEALDSSPDCTEQPADGVTFADKITAADRVLDGSSSATELERRVRALSPHIGAYVELPDGERLQVLRARAVDGGPPPGELRDEGGRLVLGCAGGALELVEVKPAGGRRMPAADYLRGRPPGTQQSPRRMTAEAEIDLGPKCPACGEPWLRATNLPGRYRCVFCMRRFELRSECPECGAHSTIARMSDTANLSCRSCGADMLRAI